MVDTLMHHYAQFMELSKANPIVASAITVFASGGIFYWLKSIPSKIGLFALRQVTTSIEFNNAGWNSNEQQFLSFLTWFQNSKWSKWSRSLSLDSPGGSKGIVIGAGFGRHFFVRDKTLYWFKKNKLASTGSNLEKMEITITAFTRNGQKLIDLVDAFRFKDDSGKVYVESWSKENQWDNRVYVPERKLAHVILNKKTKDELISRIRWWMDNEDWYRSRGLAYKLAIVLEGPPGTGKSSLLKALACEFQKNLYSINISQMTDTTLQTAFTTVEPGSIVAIEDYDSATSVQKRKRMSPTKGDTYDDGILNRNDIEYSLITTTGVLNILDGVVPLDNVIIIMTTNHIESIDPAMLRAGRTDYVFNIPYLSTDEIYEYASKMYPEYSFPYWVEFKDIAGCDIERLFKENHADPESFLRQLPRV